VFHTHAVQTVQPLLRSIQISGVSFTQYTSRQLYLLSPLYLQATLTRVWFPVGQRPQLRISPQRDCLHFYGALNWRTGQDIALSLPRHQRRSNGSFLATLAVLFSYSTVVALA
jgi:hypothetical protein